MAYNTGNPVPSNDLRDLSDNSENLDQAMNTTAETWTDRFGRPQPSMYGFEQRVNDIIIAGGKIFPDEATGRAAVGDNDYFYVASPNPNVSKAIYRRIDASTSELIVEEPSFEYVDSFLGKEISLFFEGPILFDVVAETVTFPNGIAVLHGNNFIEFESSSLPMSGVSSTFGTAYYYWFDYSTIEADPLANPFNFVSGGGGAYPNPMSNSVTLGVSYKATFNSGFNNLPVNSSRVSYKLPTILPNGNLSNAAEGLDVYGDSRPHVLDAAPLIPATNANFINVGCEYNFEIDPSRPFRGAFVDFKPAEASMPGGYGVYLSILVESVGGVWSFSGAGGPLVYVLTRERGQTVSGTVAYNESFTEFDEIDANTRLYHHFFEVPALPDNEFVWTLRLGMRSDNASETYRFGGFWASATDYYHHIDTSAFSRKIRKEDTAYPAWDSVIGIPQVSLGTPEKENTVLADLLRALWNPLHSINVRLLGDSITWGTGATGNSDPNPRSHSLDDPRNNLDARTWANWLRDYLGQVGCGVLSARVEDAPGSGYYSTVTTVDPTDETFGFSYIYPSTGRGSFEPDKIEASGAYFGWYIQFSETNNNDGWIEFEFHGDNFKVIFASITSSSPVDVYVDGELFDTFESYIGEVTFTAESPEFSVPFGKHTVQLRRIVDEGVFRFEGIRVNKRIKVSNDGIIGTNTREWVPDWEPGTAKNLISAVQEDDEFVFIQLGTNDRARPDVPTDPVRVKDTLRVTVSHLVNTFGSRIVLLVANAATNEDPEVYNFHMDSVSRAINELGEELNIPVIDQYRHTMTSIIAGDDILSDGLHPNDAGHKLMFNNIRQRLEESINGR